MTLTESRSLPWKVLYHPMLAVSLMIHGTFLFMPLPPASEPLIEIEELEPEPIELSLESLLAPPPAPSPPPPEPEPSPVAVAPPIPQEPPVYTPPPPPAEPESEALPSIEESEPEEAIAPEPPGESSAEPLPADSLFDPLPFQTAFTSNLDGMRGDLSAQNIPPAPNTIDNPDLFFTSRALTADPLPGIHQMRWFNDRRPSDVSAELQQRYAGTDMVFVEVPGGYGGGELFEIQNPEGQPFFYLNVVPGKGGVSTVLVIWAHDPTNPPSEV
jgi:hypothetical protein